MKKKLIIFGAGGHAVSVADVAMSLSYKIELFIDPNINPEYLISAPIFKEVPEKYRNSYMDVFVAVGNNFDRNLLVSKLKNDYKKFNYPNLIHPDANVSKNAKFFNGAVVFAGATINIGSKIGNFCVVNTNSSIDHESTLKDFSSIAPGVNLGGRVTLGINSFVGIGSSVKHGINIADNVVVGANSFVNEDLPDNILAFGTPAKIIRNISSTDTFL
jgi:sugar O-acyltransferase (sialic acid O-acetyltransferase NeuD family)